MKSTMIGARIEEELDGKFRALCAKQGMSVNEALKEMIRARIDRSLDPSELKTEIKDGLASAKMSLVDCTNRVLELRRKIKELEAEDSSWFGDDEIGEAKKAIHKEVRRITKLMSEMTTDNSTKEKSVLDELFEE